MRSLWRNKLNPVKFLNLIYVKILESKISLDVKFDATLIKLALNDLKTPRRKLKCFVEIFKTLQHCQLSNWSHSQHVAQINPSKKPIKRNIIIKKHSLEDLWWAIFNKKHSEEIDAFVIFHHAPKNFRVQLQNWLSGAEERLFLGNSLHSRYKVKLN